jgi:hypothetical protein
MFRTYRPFLLILCFVVLTGLACNAATNLIMTPTPEPPPTAIPRPTAAPTTIPELTLEPFPTDFTLPDVTDIPEIPGYGLPTDQPLSEWKGVPVMPGAIVGRDDGASYLFTTKSSTSEVETYYLAELEKLGWTQFTESTGQGDVVLMIFTQGSDMLTLTAFHQGGTTMVVLVR